MNISISNIAWEKEENENILEVLKKNHITGIEVAPTKLSESPTSVSDVEIQDSLSLWTDENIFPIATQSILYGHPELTIFQEEKTRGKTLSYLKEMIRVSAQLGAK